MSDQKTEDSTPFARRGARPFAGPTGAPPAGARPFARPATTQRPTAAPFAPPVVPGKRTLGSAPAPAARTATPVATQPVSPATDAATLPQPRPVTSEMVAVDAIDAFDAVWGAAEPSSGAVEPEPVASPLDEASLGSGIDGQHVWGEEIAATSDIQATEAVAPAEPAAADPTQLSPVDWTPAWLEPDVAPAPVLPDPGSATVASDASSPPGAAWPAAAIDVGDVVGEWTDSHTIPSSDEIMALAPEPIAAMPGAPSLGGATQDPPSWTGDEAHREADSQPRFEIVEEGADSAEAGPMTAPTAEAHVPREARIAAALDRLAERVQSGEIDVSSIAPDATDAAILASILAALLGGSRSR